MGKGDKRTRKGKITIGSYGNSRPKATGNGPAVSPVAKAAAPAKAEKKPRAKKA